MLLNLCMNLLLLWMTYVNGYQCDEGCVSCGADNICHTCKDGYFLDTTVYVCHKCPFNCKTCYSRYDDCTSCKPTFYGGKCEHSCFLCKNEECDNNGCTKGCKTGYYLQNHLCKECSFRCTECTVKYQCSSCKDGWWGDSCRYSCIPCSQCVSTNCQTDCRKYTDSRCTNADSICHDKCYLHHFWHRRNGTVPSTTQQSTIRSTTPSTIRSTTPSTIRSTTPSTIRSTTPSTIRSTTPSTIRSTTPSTIRSTTPTTIRSTTPTTIRSTTPSTIRSTTPSTIRSTTPTTIRSTTPTTIRPTPRPTVTRAITTIPSTLATSKTFSSHRSTTPQQRITKTTRGQEKDTETTTQYVLTTEDDKNVSPESQTDNSDTPKLYIVIAVIGVLVIVGVIMLVIYIKRRKRESRRGQVSFSPDTEEYTYAKQNKVRKMDSQAGLSNEMDLQRPNRDPSSISASEQGLGHSDRVRSNVTSHVTETAFVIDGITLEACLDESETAATEANSSTEQSMDDDTYYNVLSFQRNKVKVDKFEGYVKSKSSFDLNTEFQKFPKGLCRPYTHAKKPENMVKCRYYDVCPYDTNRVKLQGKDNDFINASYIDGYSGQNEYIASLGPTKATMDDFVDFWAMIWQDNVEKIVMLTKLMEGTTIKCEQYWPDIGNTISYGDVIVTNKSDDVYTDYTIRTLSVKKGKTTRLVYQAHFLSWPDKRVPEKIGVLLTLRDQVRSLKSEMDGPIVVHCSAGVGRTGTYIAIDILLQQLTEECAVDVFGCVIGIRGQRVAMVQTKEQYEFIHNVLVESIRKRSKY